MNGSKVLITGGASGLGEALAKAFGSAGAEVALSDIDGTAAERVAEEIRRSGGKAIASRLDVRDRKAFESWVADTVSSLGRIDYFFNNAGVGVFGLVDRHSSDDWDLLVDVNVRGVIHGIQAVYPRMLKQGSGHLINVASVAGLLTCPVLGPYGATKSFVVGLSKTMRAEAAVRGVKVSALCPGVVRTPILTGGAHGRVATLGPISVERVLHWWNRMRPIDIETFTRDTLKGVRANRAVIVLPGHMRLAWWLSRFFPSLEAAGATKDLRYSMKLFPEL